jgi:hypothetical protein
VQLHPSVGDEDVSQNENIHSKNCDPWDKNQRNAMNPEGVAQAERATAEIRQNKCFSRLRCLRGKEWLIESEVRNVHNET